MTATAQQPSRAAGFSQRRQLRSGLASAGALSTLLGGLLLAVPGLESDWPPRHARSLGLADARCRAGARIVRGLRAGVPGDLQGNPGALRSARGDRRAGIWGCRPGRRRRRHRGRQLAALTRGTAAGCHSRALCRPVPVDQRDQRGGTSAGRRRTCDRRHRRTPQPRAQRGTCRRGISSADSVRRSGAMRSGPHRHWLDTAVACALEPSPGRAPQQPE